MCIRDSYIADLFWGTATYPTNHRPDGTDDDTPAGTPAYTWGIKTSLDAGVMHRQSFNPNGPRMTLDRVQRGDGLTQTILLSENVQAGLWYQNATNSIGFGISTDVASCFGGGRPPVPTLNNMSAYGIDSMPNSNIETAAIGTTPRPASYHSGSFNAVFCGGNTRVMNDQIDPRIYTYLLSSAGTFHNQSVIGDNQY